MKNIGIYTHGGSGNHGCEALVRTLIQCIGNANYVVYSQRPDEDKKYIDSELVRFILGTKDGTLLEKMLNKMQGFERAVQRYYAPTIEGTKKMDVMISIGGDNYCYDDYRKIPGILRKKFSKSVKTILFGCSIDKNSLADLDVLEDLKKYDLITAREKLSYNLLVKALPESNIKYFPDSAFLLPIDNSVEMPFKEDCVGINVSPMVLQPEYSNGILMNNIYDLINHILDDTRFNVLLIPHVVWNFNDDRKVLNEIYDEYKDSGRVYLIKDANCCCLKGIISRCRFFIGARTHATIAAYSACVPTIVLGYSIKSQGIARDIFGDDENYLVSVINIGPGELTKKFDSLVYNEKKIYAHLVSFMPKYLEKAKNIKSALQEIINES